MDAATGAIPLDDEPSGSRVTGFSAAAGWTALRRSLTLCHMSWAVLWRSFVLSCALAMVWPNLGLMQRAMEGIRRLGDRYRDVALRWSGVRIPPPPAELPPVPAGASGTIARYRWLAGNPQTRREGIWVFAEPVVGAFLAFLPIALVIAGVWGMFLGFFGPRLAREWDGLWFEFVPIDGTFTAVLAGLLGAAHLPLALWAAPRTVRRHAEFTRSMLAPSESEVMASRIRHLAATRSEAVDTQMAEIQRIERDLHDGAQARLVAMGMTLDAAEHLLDTNPEAVRTLLVEARESSSKALEELRNLVRGIHPPVLADRGLADAVRALALVSPIPTDVEIDLPGRPHMPVESAAYFAVNELLANIAKHAAADHVRITLGYDHGVLRIVVSDDGRGGADAARGTGLRGIQRRLATFDGVLAVDSPAGGPTTATMEIPCALSSPKTTSS
ncbi:sensor histidine kinase [Yinghuangia aomiensis]|uniref:histidine kinase n=1 Tax=Yinghuangia aomiensis TaxID=676205 RepID=A0ABP9I554_9ACTN